MVRLKALQAGGAADGQAEFKFHMVRLKERKFCHVNSREHTFKFHMVRLKALSKDELAKILRFKFHMVRLKDHKLMVDMATSLDLNSTWYD